MDSRFAKAALLGALLYAGLPNPTAAQPFCYDFCENQAFWCSEGWGTWTCDCAQIANAAGGSGICDLDACCTYP
jgi:hypothetical protein